ncbi:EF-hand domain-containing family member C2-like [Tubulanus polymorphus]|uniref:EF-hand domain-containing family member C2-like n=1 Tax=Tubulanus polymorphus TaxID=672921 RepID=UPI003DA384B9
MALPLLPGNVFNGNLGKQKFHKSQQFDYRNEVPMMVGAEKPGIGGEPLPGQKLKPKSSVFPRGEGADLPAWVAFDRQVLCFDAYFQEGVNEKREEQYRVRGCKIYFYLEDDSIQVIEPRIKNSGVPQGTLIRRHKIMRPPPNDDEFYNVDDFNVGSELAMYGRTFKLTGCDEFTYNFLKKLGVRVNAPSSTPGDPYTSYRKCMDESMQPLRPYEKHDTLKQFLNYDRLVLRFYCIWDDTDSMFGDLREMVLHYFLADDTIEIREVIYPNSGRDAAPMFVRRGKLPKHVLNLKQPGVQTNRTVLNVFGPMGQGGRYILDSLKTGAVHTDFYTDSDLMIGVELNVLGRKIKICDCDTFTREYFRTKYGIEEFKPIEYRRGGGTKVTKQTPPYNGFGSEEDSLCSTEGLIPKPPKRDFIKFMQMDRHGLDSNVMRFLARMDTDKPIDADRRFIISYFLSDDTVQVFEPPVRNSGIIGGKFLERGKMKKPNQPRYSTQPAEFYTATDFFVGANVEFNCHKFILIDADEYAFAFMEMFPDSFPKASVKHVMKRLGELIKGKEDEIASFFRRNDADGRGVVGYDQFYSLMVQLVPGITHQEIMTLARHYSDQATDRPMEIVSLLAVVHEHLRKDNFEGFQSLLENFIHHDKDRAGSLTPELVRTAFRALHVPVPDDILRILLTKLAESNNGVVDYCALLQQLNWRENPVSMAPPLMLTGARADEWSGTETKNQITVIKYEDILKDMSC